MTRSALRIALLVLGAACPLGSAAQSPAYPATPRDCVVDDFSGTKVADPYRWLERLDDPRTTAWVDAQRRLTRGILERLPQREPIRRRLTVLWNASRTDVPWRVPPGR